MRGMADTSTYTDFADFQVANPPGSEYRQQHGKKISNDAMEKYM